MTLCCSQERVEMTSYDPETPPLTGSCCMLSTTVMPQVTAMPQLACSRLFELFRT